MKSRRHFYVAVALLASLVILGELYFRLLVEVGMGEKVPLSRPLASIPRELGDWSGRDQTIPPNTLLEIGAMDTLKRSYDPPTGSKKPAIDLYIAYFGGVRGTAPHHPDVCMPGAGYDLIQSDVVPLQVPGFAGRATLVRQDVFERLSDQSKRLVVWWEYVHGENVANRTMQRLKWVLPKLMGGERGSILQVQVGVNYSGDVRESLAAATDFIGKLGPYLHDVLPAEGGNRAPASPQAGTSAAPGSK